jgi:hypothetical protein
MLLRLIRKPDRLLQAEVLELGRPPSLERLHAGVLALCALARDHELVQGAFLLRQLLDLFRDISHEGLVRELALREGVEVALHGQQLLVELVRHALQHNTCIR